MFVQLRPRVPVIDLPGFGTLTENSRPSPDELDRFAEQSLVGPYKGIPGLTPDQLVRCLRKSLRSSADQHNVSMLLHRGRNGSSAIGALQELPWDTECLGFRCAKMELFVGAGGSDDDRSSSSETIVEHVLEIARNRGYQMVSSKCPADLPILAHCLEAAGFRLMDCELTLAYAGNPRNRSDLRSGGVRVESVRNRDISGIEAIGNYFSRSRFHADQKIPQKLADRLWRKSVANACRDRADEVFVAFDGERPVGLVSCLDDPFPELNSDRPVRSLFHVGVLPDAQGKGVGSSLMEAALRGSHKAAAIRVETQSTNYDALNLYQKFEFRIVSSHYSFHCWI